MTKVPRLRFVRRVTARHGERFATRWHDRSLKSLELRCESFKAAALIEWPDDPSAQRRYQDLEDEIFERTCAGMRRIAAAAFVAAAREVLRRERRR
jgi:hypothetical protein